VSFSFLLFSSLSLDLDNRRAYHARRSVHVSTLEICPGQQLARCINKEYWALLHDYGIETDIRWIRIPGHSGIPGNEEAVRQANVAREGRGSTVREQAFISATNRARRITEQSSSSKPNGKRRDAAGITGTEAGRLGAKSQFR
jgi:hypothetical protein